MGRMAIAILASLAWCSTTLKVNGPSKPQLKVDKNKPGTLKVNETDNSTLKVNETDNSTLKVNDTDSENKLNATLNQSAVENKTQLKLDKNKKKLNRTSLNVTGNQSKENKTEEPPPPFRALVYAKPIRHTLDSKFWWDEVVHTNARRLRERESTTVLLYGDQNAEVWNGVVQGANSKEHAKHPALWKELFDDRYGPSQASGIAGDGMTNLLYRLQHRESPTVIAQDAQPKVIMVHIGTNDIDNAFYSVPTYKDYPKNVSEGVSAGHKKVVQELRSSAPDAKIVLTSIFPRGKNWGGSPTRYYEKVITDVNSKMAKMADNSTIFYSDCGSILLNREGKVDVHPKRTTDFFHLTYEAFKSWGGCLQKTLDPILLQTPEPFV